MKRFVFLSLSGCLLAGVAVAAAAAKPAPSTKPKAAPVAVKLAAKTDREAALYQAGDKVQFTITGEPADALVQVVLSKDGFQPQPPRSVKLINGKATVEGSLDEPGFLQLLVTSGKTKALAAAGFEPEKIKPSLPLPDDFDAFWQKQKQALATVPAKAELTPVKSPVEGVEVFDVKVACVDGAPVSGYFGKPSNAKPRSLPAILRVHGAGVVSASLGSMNWAVREGGMLAFDINAHGIPNGRPQEFYKELYATKLRDYPRFGRLARDTIYFKNMFLRLVRAIDFLAAQPEWDGKTLIVHGSSQGGFQAFAAAALDERVSFFCAGVPAGCDHSGMEANRIAGWPKLVATDEQGAPAPASLQAARYFDNVNFALRSHAKGAAVTVGFIDATCPPTSVYAAYNALTIPKKLHIDTLAGHTNTPAAVAFMEKAVLEHVRAQREAEK